MACCQERACLLFIFVCIFQGLIAHAESSLLTAVPSHVLQRKIKLSRHQPFCVIFKQSGVDTKLEKTVSTLWKQPVTVANYTTWQCTAFDPDQTKLPPKTARPEKLPSLRCYLGETSVYAYKGKATRTRLNEWFGQLDSLYSEQNEEVTADMFAQVQGQYRIILLAFPDGPRHHEVEDMVYEIANNVESCKALAVHLNSKEASRLRAKYAVNKFPSVVVIYNHVTVDVNNTLDIEEVYRVFTNQHVNKHVLQVYIQAMDIAAPHISMAEFEEMFQGTDGPEILICFYANYASDVTSYLTAFRMTVDAYKQTGGSLKFGMMDLAQDSTKKFVRRIVKQGATNAIPFLILFQKEGGQLSQTVYHVDRPYPWIISAHTGLLDVPEPWGVVTSEQVSSHVEGPRGSLCWKWSSNRTDSEPYIPRVIVKHRPKPVKKMEVKKPQEKTWHDVFDTDQMEKKLSKLDSIPLITLKTWSDIVEKSHAPRHIFYKAGKWAGEVTKVSLVVFIMADCGSCRRNHQNFLNIQKAVAHIDGGSMYYVNCTDEQELCSNHDIRGYPTITAFRGLGWLDNSTCSTKTSKLNFKNYVRLDYHGVIQPDPVLSWFSKVADNALIARKFNTHLGDYTEKNIRLISTLMPVSMVLSPGHSYKCMRLLCERLYSVVDCVSIYSDLGEDNTLYEAEDAQLTITKIEMERQDGISATLMKLGVSLHDTLEDQTDTDLHKFHIPHSYKLAKDQLCETDHAKCTDALMEFVLDHNRLPITPVSTNRFHTSSSHLREDNLPVLIAMAHPDNLTQSSFFMKELTAAAYDLYKDMVVMTLDTNKYSVWAAQFVPKLYGHQRTFDEDSDDPDPLGMFVYPRLCIVEKHDHDHAALYPPIKRLLTKKRKKEDFTREAITVFAWNYLDNPHTAIIETEHF